jgi:hypothetical protein
MIDLYMLPLVIKLVEQMCHSLHLKMILENMFFLARNAFSCEIAVVTSVQNLGASTFQVYAARMENLGCTASNAPHLIGKSVQSLSLGWRVLLAQ